MTPALHVAGLRAIAGDAVLLDGIDLTLDPGRVVAVVGPSGAGKSTLGLAALGKSDPGVTLAGRVRVGDVDLLGAGPRPAGLVGYLPQHPGAVLDPVRRCGRVLHELAATVHGRDRAARTAAVGRALELVRLDPALVHRFPHQLSGGQQQRMALAQTIVTAPAVVVLDEPTTGLDPATAAELVGRLADLAAAGTALLLLTHDHGVARALADRVVELDAGTIRRTGTADEVLGAPATPVTRPRAPARRPRLAVERLSVLARDGARLLDDVSLAVDAGEWVAVHGRSGAGKTTLARAVAGLVVPRSGTVAVDGVRLAPAVGDRDRTARRRVQYVHQDAASSFLPDRPVLDQVVRGAVLLRGLDPAAARAEADELLGALGVAVATTGRRPGALSGGQLQRAAVARALLCDPAVLVADEMTSALDPEHRRGLLAVVDARRRECGVAVLAVSHDQELSARVADRVVVLDEGRVVDPDLPAGHCGVAPCSGWTR